MSKLHLAGIIFLIVMIIAFIPLTAEVFGDMNATVITVSGAIAFIGLIGSCICNFIRGVMGMKKK